MSAGGGHPGEVIKFEVLAANYNTVLLKMSHEDVQYFVDKVGKHGIGDFRFGDGSEHHSGPEKGGG